MSSKSKPSALPFGLALIAVTAATAGALYYQHRHTPVTPIVQSGEPLVPTPVPNVTFTEALPSPNPAAAENPIIFRVVSDSNGSHLKMTHMTNAQAVAPTGTPPAQNALNMMAAAEDSPLPVGTQVLSYTPSADNSTVTVDFNDAFVKNFPGGDTAESLAIESILATVGQFGPKSVQITVEGKKIDSLGGTQSLMSPLTVPQRATSEQTADKGGATP